MNVIKWLSCIILGFSFSFSAQADANFIKRPEVQEFINKMVRQHGFTRQQLSTVMQAVEIQPQIITSMDQPFENKTWDIYKQLFLTPERLQNGLAFWQNNQETLKKAEAQYGVPASVIIAVLGVETLYGKRQGNYRVIDALSTLAFNYPKRADFFKKELVEYLLLCREHHVSPMQYYGSYAGAIGKPQFMPSSYRAYAADFTNNPKKDLINDDAAAIVSVANYLAKHGWQDHQGIAQPAKITGTGYKRFNTAFRTAEYPLGQLMAAGVRPLTAAANHPQKAGLIEMTTQQGPEYWLAYPNFFVITRYNTSPQYALAVYLLSQQLHESWKSSQQNHKIGYA